LNSFFLLAGALLFDEKIRQSAALFWCGSRGSWNSSNNLPQGAVIHRTIVDFPAFLDHGLVKKIIKVCAHTNSDPNKQEVGFIFV
jgi:hypothetical protein